MKFFVSFVFFVVAFMVKLTAMIEDEILSILAETGPLTGAQLLERTRMDIFSLWQTCRRSPSIRLETSGRRFLRLDRNVEGYARLSPSIRREFLTYMFVGLDGQTEALKARADRLRNQIREISQNKRDIAYDAIGSVVTQLSSKDSLLEKACFMLAGDVVYDMSHRVPRPEKSTGEMVQGSDLDIVIIVEDALSSEIVDALDRAVHKRKHLLLINDREEIDYLIKTMSRVREQLKFDIFSSMVACKILDEGRLLYGSPAVFQKTKDLLAGYGIAERLRELERQATLDRELAESQLLQASAEEARSEYLNLFYTHAEEDEIY
jgi:hypothetical protein